MILLTTASDKLQAVTAQARLIDVHATWIDNAAGVATPGRANSAITTAATTDIVASPAAGKQRNVKTVYLFNRDSAAADITVQHTDGTLVAQLHKVTLPPGATLQYEDEHGFIIGGMQSTTTVASGFTTGDAKITLKTVADASWVMMNDGTIGNASSGATTRANADTQDLFTLLFDNINDTNAPILTSAGAATTRAAQTNAVTAWTNNCRMSLTRQLGRALAVGGTGAGLTARALGETLGEERHAQSVAEMAPHGHGGRTTFNYLWAWAGVTITYGGTEPNVLVAVNSNSISTSTAVTIDAAGAGTPFNVMQPTSFWNVMIKL
jgi:hypothetical protein